MGVETVVIVGAAIAAAGTAYGVTEQRSAAKKSASAQKEGQAISSAAQANADAEARRQAVRQQRIRTAQVEQSAANTGVSDSSGELGSLSALSTNASAGLANMSGRTLASNGITAAGQNTADAQMRGQIGAGIGQIGTSIGAGIMSNAGAISGGFSSKPTAKLDMDVNNLFSDNPDLF